jgi:serine/threonine protein kinase
MGKLYGKWRVMDSLGEGGQAHVFLVESLTDGSVAVLKRLKNVKRLERFESEFAALSSLEGKGFFPKVLAVDLSADAPYIVMEYFANGSVTEAMVDGWTLDEKITFYENLIEAVGNAHDSAVIHRDLKPANILVTDEKLPRVTDFGICYVDEAGTRQTLVDEPVGSFRFMAPEMEDGRSDLVGTATDVYSLGKLGYWLFSGKIYNRERHRDPQFDLSAVGSEHWRYFFNDFLDRATAVAPTERLQTTAEVRLAFQKVRNAMSHETRYLDIAIDQKCIFCRTGTYKTMHNSATGSDHPSALNDFGFQAVGNPKALIMVCESCGNTQIFRRDLCNKWSWK